MLSITTSDTPADEDQVIYREIAAISRHFSHEKRAKSHGKSHHLTLIVMVLLLAEEAFQGVEDRGLSVRYPEVVGQRGVEGHHVEELVEVDPDLVVVVHLDNEIETDPESEHAVAQYIAEVSQ